MCHEPSGSAMRPTIGAGRPAVTLDDFELADLIFNLGQNPGTNHPRMLGGLRRARGSAWRAHRQPSTRCASLGALCRPAERCPDGHRRLRRPSARTMCDLPVGGDLAF